MGNFSRDRRPSGGRSFGHSFGGGKGGGGRAPMFQAVCGNCGNSCEVPFKPTAGRPVLCSKCFEESGNGGREPRGPRFNDRRGNDFRGNDNRQMFAAICSKCGKSCSIPFEPRNGKPVFCSDCFEAKERGSSGNTGEYKAQLEAISAKLDKILGILAPTPVIKEEKVVKVEEVKPIEEKKVAKTKKTVKKASSEAKK